MGERTATKSARNKQLAADYQEKNADGTYKVGIDELMIKYDLSQQRIYAILKSMGIPSERGGIAYYNTKIRKPRKEVNG